MQHDHILRHILALILAAFLIFMGIQKFGETNAVFQYLAEQSGIGLFEPVVRTLTGIAELGAAALLVWPRTRAFGALAAVGVIGGAIVFHLTPWLGINAPVAFDESGAYVRSPMLFIMAVASFLFALGVLAHNRAGLSLKALRG